MEWIEGRGVSDEAREPQINATPFILSLLTQFPRGLPKLFRHEGLAELLFLEIIRPERSFTCWYFICLSSLFVTPARFLSQVNY
jgi:hypothetical protein